MTRSLQQYELPAQFIERFRPVKTQPREKGLPVYLFDPYGLTFYCQTATARAIPADAIWSVIRPESRAGLQLVHGQGADAVGYVIAQALPRDADPDTYLLPVRLGYRARISVQALHRLRQDLARSHPLAAAEVIALIEQRIDAYHYPAELRMNTRPLPASLPPPYCQRAPIAPPRGP